MFISRSGGMLDHVPRVAMDTYSKWSISRRITHATQLHNEF